MTHPVFADRAEAGRRLAAELPALERPIVLALPRGGVPVADAVARALDAPLDVFVVRKLGLPAQPELAMGAVARGGVRVLNEAVLAQAAVPTAVLEEVSARELAEVEARERLYRGDRAPLDVRGREVVLVDDGIATGATMRAAIAALQAHEPKRLVVAVPVAPDETCALLRRADVEVVCVLAPRSFLSVGTWYDDFTPVLDDTVVGFLRASL